MDGHRNTPTLGFNRGQRFSSGSREFLFVHYICFLASFFCLDIVLEPSLMPLLYPILLNPMLSKHSLYTFITPSNSLYTVLVTY